MYKPIKCIKCLKYSKYFYITTTKSTVTLSYEYIAKLKFQSFFPNTLPDLAVVKMLLCLEATFLKLCL